MWVVVLIADVGVHYRLSSLSTGVGQFNVQSSCGAFRQTELYGKLRVLFVNSCCIFFILELGLVVQMCCGYCRIYATHCLPRDATYKYVSPANFMEWIWRLNSEVVSWGPLRLRKRVCSVFLAKL